MYSSSKPVAIGSKSRLTPSAPRARTAAAVCLARLSLAVGLPSSAPWSWAWPVDHAITLIVSTTRVPLAWAALMIEVIFELVQPPQPVVGEPSESSFSRLPFLSAPTLK